MSWSLTTILKTNNEITSSSLCQTSDERILGCNERPKLKKIPGAELRSGSPFHPSIAEPVESDINHWSWTSGENSGTGDETHLGAEDTINNTRTGSVFD